MGCYVIGIDFGTLSARAVLVDTKNGAELACEEFQYPHAVIDQMLPDGTPVPRNAAFQHPKDYTDALTAVISGVLKSAAVPVGDVVGLGIDFTACTVLPLDAQGQPLCYYEKYRSEPHAYVKLWKHHSAQPEADKITDLARQRGERWLDMYGGNVSSEWLFPKLLETARKAPAVFSDTAYFMEAADWLVWMLTGDRTRSSCMAGFKGLWNKVDGDVSREFLEELQPGFGAVLDGKVSGEVRPTGSLAGRINEAGSKLTGLLPGTAVAVPIIDAHAALPAAGITEDGVLMLILGTSSCQIVMDKNDHNVPGIFGRVQDGIVPGYVAYESGQAAVGDAFDWYIKNCVPYTYMEEARAHNQDIFSYMTDKAGKLTVGETGLVALDWWNGNRCPYADSELTGAIFGFTLRTKPEEIYRAMLESTAFGTKMIVDNFEQHGLQIREVYATGGISQKNSLMMQIYSDVLGKPVLVPKLRQAGAMGSAVLAAYAAGEYETVSDAAEKMVQLTHTRYTPDLSNTQKYKEIYNRYAELSNMFATEKKHLVKD